MHLYVYPCNCHFCFFNPSRVLLPCPVQAGGGGCNSQTSSGHDSDHTGVASARQLATSGRRGKLAAALAIPTRSQESERRRVGPRQCDHPSVNRGCIGEWTSKMELYSEITCSARQRSTGNMTHRIVLYWEEGSDMKHETSNYHWSEPSIAHRYI